MPSLGVLSLAAVLEKADIPVRTLPAHMLKMDIPQIAKWVEKEEPDVFGITVTTENRLEAFDVARAVKKARPATITVLGGPHCTSTALDTMNHIPEVDMVVAGEGEVTIVELMNAIDAGGSVSDFARIDGLSYRTDDGKPVSNGLRSKLPDLNILPMPARHMEDMEIYNFFVDVPGKGKLPAANIMTSRGCPFDCNFCATPTNWGRKVRGLEPSRVIEEIEYCIEKYGVKVIWFYDDTFNYNPKRLETICDMIIERKLDINWFCEVRIDALSRELFDKMVEAGMFHFGFGVESANERVCLDIIHKKATLAQAREVIRWAQEMKVTANPFFIFSHPTEVWSEALETLEFAESLQGKAQCSMAILHIYPSTQLWDRAVKEGKIPKDFTWTNPDDQRILELPEAQGRIPLYLDNLSWYQISTIIFRFSQSAMKVSLFAKMKKAAKRINSFKKFRQYFVMGLAFLNLKIKNAMGIGAGKIRDSEDLSKSADY